MEIRRKALLFFVTCGFIGYLPFAPGTWASVLGGVLLYLFPFSTLTGNLIFVGALLLVSVTCVNLFNPEQKDPGYIVIDELVGMYVTMAGHKPAIMNILAGFVFFRFFDVLKPFPVNRAERLNKGYGVVADDVVAGIFASCALFLMGRII